MQWRVVSDSALRFRSWGDEFIVYNSLSGDTHLLGLAAAQILLKLQEAPSDTIILTEALAPLLQTETGEGLALQIEYLLADLVKLALIERT